jgi:hypothetical protein
MDSSEMQEALTSCAELCAEYQQYEAANPGAVKSSDDYGNDDNDDEDWSGSGSGGREDAAADVAGGTAKNSFVLHGYDAQRDLDAGYEEDREVTPNP